jgi:hypothetical protein
MNRYQIIKSEYPDRVEYTLNGLLHREDGPAIERSNGSKAWFIDGKAHRGDGPARILSDGTKYWYINNKLHRINGPAVEYNNGSKAWFIDGNQLSEKEFNQYLLKHNLEKI